MGAPFFVRRVPHSIWREKSHRDRGHRGGVSGRWVYIMKKFTRPPMYRSARAVPSSVSPPPCGAPRFIKLLLFVIAFIMVMVNLFHVLPMFLAVDSHIMSTIMAHIDHGAAVSSSLSGGSNVGGDGDNDLHHGVHKNLIEHKLGVQEHIKICYSTRRRTKGCHWRKIRTLNRS